MPTYPHIDSYYEQLRELIEFGGATNEENIRLAFLNCLSDYCKEHSERFVLVPELRSDRSNKPDGTVRDSLRMTRGLWEAKDTHDDLDREIQNKLGQGYSGDNILFENSRTAVLVQGDQGSVADGHDRPGRSRRVDSEVSRLRTAGDPGVSGSEAAVQGMTCRPCWRAFVKPS